MANLSIKAVSKIVGVTPFTLRAWEKRYRLLKPKRSENGRRNYSLSDLEKLRLVVTLKQAGHSLSEIANLSVKELTQLLDNTSLQSPKKKSLRSASPSPQLENLLHSIRQTDLDQLAGQLKLLQFQLDTKSFLLEVLVPLLQILGSEVYEGRLEVFHEHAVSALIKHLLMGLLYSTERSTDFRQQEPIIFATPENDHHEFGVLIATILALINGCRVFYLGPHMPADSLAKAAKALKSPLIVLSATAPDQTLSREQLRIYFANLVRDLPKSTALWFGGARVEDFRYLSKELRRSDLTLRSLEEFDRNLRLQMRSV